MYKMSVRPTVHTCLVCKEEVQLWHSCSVSLVSMVTMPGYRGVRGGGGLEIPPTLFPLLLPVPYLQVAHKHVHCAVRNLCYKSLLSVSSIPGAVSVLCFGILQDLKYVLLRIVLSFKLTHEYVCVCVCMYVEVCVFSFLGTSFKS
jgi:hypothetical protein